MSKFKNYLLFVFALAIAAAIIGSQARAWSNPEPETLPVSIQLSDISKNPHDLLNRKVTFECRFAAQGNMFRAKDKVFTPRDYENFSIWNSGIKFWSDSELKNVYPTMYISKEHEELINRLRILDRFNKIEVIGVVESIYANIPWIRVESIKLIHDDELDQAMVSQINRGVKFIDNGEFQKANICFEIAQERTMPKYVEEFIDAKLVEIENIRTQNSIAIKRHESEQILEQAREYAKNSSYEKAATTYGKALKSSKEYNNSPSIHKEIAGFFIDFYNDKQEESLLEYSVNELKIAQKLIGNTDGDILYALAYIETLKAKKSNNYNQAESLARKCLEVNTHHYGGRKLLADIMSCQISVQTSTAEPIILPVAPKKRIKLPKIESEEEDIAVEIDDLISSQELIAMENEIEQIETTLVSETKYENEAETIESFLDEDLEGGIPGLSATDFKGILETDINLNQDDINDTKISISLDTQLPDFPISENDSKLPRLAL